MLLLLLTTAHAAPTFTGTPEDVALATRVWDAAHTCTSRNGVAHATVAIRRDLVGDEGAIGGAASWDGKGLHTIELTKDAPSVLLAHEVGHAWFTGTGPLGPIEGRTELLAECVARSHRDVIPYLYDAYELLDDMPELTTWTAAAQKTMTPQQVQAAYAGSLRFFLAMGAIVPPSDLFAAGAMDWARVRALLGKDPRGAPLLAALDGGVEAERRALADPDQDGVTTIVETMHGMDPKRWDTDGDGWWDGRPASLPPGALPVPHDSSRICPHKLAGEGETRLIVGGNLRGFDLGGYALTLSGGNNYLKFAPELAERPGGYWYLVIGKSLADNPRCRVTPLVTVRAVDDATPEELDALVQALAAAHAKVATLVPLTKRLVVDVTGNGVVGGSGGATVASDVVGWAMKKPELRMPVLATTIVAKIVIPHGDRLRIEQEAFAQAMVLTVCANEERVPAAGVTDAQIKAAQKRVDEAGGWASFVGG